MKKILIILFTILLTSCSLFNKDKEDDISKAKEELLWTGITATEDTESTTLEESSEVDEEVKIEITDEPTVAINSLNSWTPMIEIEDLSNKDFYAWEFYINWKTLWNVDKIEVIFSNKTSSYPEDLYTLWQFKSWDSTFKYMASSNFKTLDFWLNEYIFTAYSWEFTYKVKVEINLPEKEIKNVVIPEKVTQTTTNSSTSNSEDLTIVNNENVSEITCEWEVLTNYLVENYGYTYWNSCRDIIKGKSIGFYVLRLKWENYFYEKHYVDYEKKVYWVLLLETWYWVTKEMLKEKNDELKQMSFDKTTDADKEFKN